MANLLLICGVAYAGHVIVSIRTPRSERHRYELALPVLSPERPKKYWPQSPDQRNVHRMVLICVTFRTSSGMGSIPNNVALQSVVKPHCIRSPLNSALPRGILGMADVHSRFADRCVWHRPRATEPVGCPVRPLAVGARPPNPDLPDDALDDACGRLATPAGATLEVYNRDFPECSSAASRWSTPTKTAASKAIRSGCSASTSRKATTGSWSTK